MTKKDYIRAAQIAKVLPPKDRDIAVYCFIRLFRESPRFDADKFYKACEP